MCSDNGDASTDAYIPKSGPLLSPIATDQSSKGYIARHEHLQLDSNLTDYCCAGSRLYVHAIMEDSWLREEKKEVDMMLDLSLLNVPLLAAMLACANRRIKPSSFDAALFLAMVITLLTILGSGSSDVSVRQGLWERKLDLDWDK